MSAMYKTMKKAFRWRRLSAGGWPGFLKKFHPETVFHSRSAETMKNDRQPEAILKLARQFMESRILLTAAELNLFSLLDRAPATARDLADRLHADLRGLTILLDALAAMDLIVKREDGAYQSSPEAAAFLSDESPRSVQPMVLHAVHLWENWSELTGKVRPVQSSAEESQGAKKDDGLEAFIGAMHVIGAPLAQRIVAAIEPGPAENLIDVGGASGTYTLAFLRAAPKMTATLFDRPAVISLARERLAEAGMQSRVRLVPGDFYKDELPGGHDLAMLSAIIHQNSPAQNVELFRKVYRALVSGGRLIIRDHVMEPGRARPKAGAIFAVNMLVNTKGGSTYTFDEIEKGLEEAGFIKVRMLRSGEQMDALVEAFKP
ncbi:MAG: methyltransferase domain-containing protein [Deltaproteobacteria bacterium]|nr:methyltransferase domain-containing protein [Deltaproteobacteria bacterium]